jgi:hypothetical protein
MAAPVAAVWPVEVRDQQVPQTEHKISNQRAFGRSSTTSDAPTINTRPHGRTSSPSTSQARFALRARRRRLRPISPRRCGC